MIKTVSRAEQAMFYASVNVQYFGMLVLKMVLHSAQEAEYVVLSMAMRDLLPFKRLVQTIFMSLVFEKNQKFNILCSI